jgi:flagellin-specific chaperone FliS
MWMNRQLLDGNIRKDTAPLESVRAVLLELRSAWAELAEKAGAQNPARNASGVNIAG